MRIRLPSCQALATWYEYMAGSSNQRILASLEASLGSTPNLDARSLLNSSIGRPFFRFCRRRNLPLEGMGYLMKAATASIQGAQTCATSHRGTNQEQLCQVQKIAARGLDRFPVCAMQLNSESASHWKQVYFGRRTSGLPMRGKSRNMTKSSVIAKSCCMVASGNVTSKSSLIMPPLLIAK